MITLLGACGLERLAAALRARGVAVSQGGLGDAALARAPGVDLVYVDLFDWSLSTALWSGALRRSAVDLDLRPQRALLQQLEGLPVLLRGPRHPSPLALGPGWAPDPFAPLAALAEGWPQLDVQALWARHGVVEDGVAFGVGHGEPLLDDRGLSRMDGASAAELEAGALLALRAGRQGQAARAFAVDLDDTLIFGELADDEFGARNPAWGDGPAHAPPEIAWWRAPRGLHEALQVARHRGALLTLVTRNPEALVRARFRRRSDAGGAVGEALRLLLDVDDFVAVEAGFGPKSAALRRLSGRLGLPLDAFAFIDDHPAERAEVLANAAGVRALDPAAAREALIAGPGLLPWPAPAVDRGPSLRARLALDAARDQGEHEYEQFLSELNLMCEAGPARPGELPRVEELLRRTNQLRLGGARRGGLLPGDAVCVGFARDRLADHGLVAALVVAAGPAGPEAVDFACSCRVMLHQVAAPLLGAMLQLAGGLPAPPWRGSGRDAAAAGLADRAAGPPPPFVRLRLRPPDPAEGPP